MNVIDGALTLFRRYLFCLTVICHQKNVNEKNVEMKETTINIMCLHSASIHVPLTETLPDSRMLALHAMCHTSTSLAMTFTLHYMNSVIWIYYNCLLFLTCYTYKVTWSDAIFQLNRCRCNADKVWAAVRKNNIIWIKCDGDRFDVVEDTTDEYDTDSPMVSQTDKLWYTWLFVDE